MWNIRIEHSQAEKIKDSYQELKWNSAGNENVSFIFIN